MNDTPPTSLTESQERILAGIPSVSQSAFVAMAMGRLNPAPTPEDDEVWTTIGGKTIRVGDMSEAHAKNALRAILRKRRLDRLRNLEQSVPFDPDDCAPGGCDHYGSLEN